jgi:hypothetical protein
MTLMRREYPGGRWAKANEIQDGKRLKGKRKGRGRGAIHHHATFIHAGAKSVDAQRIRELGMRAGYGCNVMVQVVARGAVAVANYLTKYITKAVDEGMHPVWRTYRCQAAVEKVNRATGEVKVRRCGAQSHDGVCRKCGAPTRLELAPRRLRTWSASRSWGCTLQEVKAGARRAVEARDAARAMRAVMHPGVGAPERGDGEQTGVPQGSRLLPGPRDGGAVYGAGELLDVLLLAKGPGGREMVGLLRDG